MKTILIAASLAAALACAGAGVAHAQIRGGAYNNAAGGVTAGQRGDAYGPWGSRAAGERGVVTNGDGDGVAGQRGCARGGGGGVGCSAGSVAWDEGGNVNGERGGAFVGRNGNYGSSYGSFERDENGDINGSRDSEVHVGDRTYSAETTFETGEGFDRDVICSGSGC